MSIPPRFFDEIRNRLNLSDIIGRRVKVTRAGREYKACCPFHREKTPSFTINDDKQFYHCFGCGAHGDVIKFTMEHDNLEFMDAIEYLAAEAGLQVPKPDPKQAAQAKRAKDLHDLLEEATSYMQEQLYTTPQGQVAHDYLKNRGFTGDILNTFKIGFAPADGQAIRKYLAARDYTDKQMIEGGILRPGKNGREPYAFFRERIMFPVTDRRGRVVAYGGRILPDHLRAPDTGDYTPAKYMNSSDTPLFDKGRTLYNEQFARLASREDQPVIVTEGYMDVIACHKAGFKGAVAPMGTSLTENQMINLWQMIPAQEKVPILCFDGDNAGRRAAERAIDRVLPLLKPGQSVKFAFLPDGEDPDTLIKNRGREAFQKILQASTSLFDFLWSSHTAGRDLTAPELRAGAINDMRNVIAKIADAQIQRHYKALLDKKVSDTFFRRDRFAGGRFTKSKKPKVGQGLHLRKPAFRSGMAKHMIYMAALLNHPSIYNRFDEFYGSFEIANPAHNRLRQSLISLLDDDPDLDIKRVKECLTEQGFKSELSEILNESVYVHAAFCAPHYNTNEVADKLSAFLNELEGRDWNAIKHGWKSAQSIEDEQKIKEMIKLKNAADERANF